MPGNRRTFTLIGFPKCCLEELKIKLKNAIN